MADARIKFIVELIDKFSGKSKKITDELKKTEKAAEGADKELSGLEKAFKLAGTAAVAFLAVNTVKAVVALNALREESERADRALVAFAGGSDEAAAALDAVVEAGDGIVSKLEASRNAAKLFSMGLAETAEEAGNLTEMAINLGSAMGKDAAQSFEEFSLLLANMSIPRLDTFGISASQVRARIKELREETEGLSREQAFMTAVTEIGADSLDKLKEAGFEAGSETDRLKASWEDYKLVMSDSVDIENAIGLLDELVDGMARTQEVANELSDAVDAGTISFSESRAMMRAGKEAGDDYAGMLEELTLLESQNTENAVGGHRRRRTAIKKESDALAELADSAEEVVEEIEEMTNAELEALSASELFNLALEDQIRGLGGVDTGLQNTIEGFKEQVKWIEAGGLALQKTADEAMANYLAGTISATQAQKIFNNTQLDTIIAMEELDGMSLGQIEQTIRNSLGLSFAEAKTMADGIWNRMNQINGLQVLAEIKIIATGATRALRALSGAASASPFNLTNTQTTQQSGRTIIMPPSAANESGFVTASAGEKVQVTSKSSTLSEALGNTLGNEDAPERAGRAMARELMKMGIFG